MWVWLNQISLWTRGKLHAQIHPLLFVTLYIVQLKIFLYCLEKKTTPVKRLLIKREKNNPRRAMQSFIPHDSWLVSKANFKKKRKRKMVAGKMHCWIDFLCFERKTSLENTCHLFWGVLRNGKSAKQMLIWR